MTRLFFLTVLRFASFGAAVVALVLLGYVYYDPYKVVHDRSDYSNNPPDVMANRDHISVSVYLRNRDEQKYNAFIFGSSRASAFRPSKLVDHLGPEARPFLFNASAESLEGIASKIRYLDSCGTRIDHVLIILCRDLTFNGKGRHKGPVFIKHPAVMGGTWWNYHRTFLSAYLSPEFIHAYYLGKITRRYYPWMKDVLAGYRVVYDTLTNEETLYTINGTKLNITKEAEILSDPEKFYSERQDVFYERKPRTEKEQDQITPEHEALLVELTQIFKRQGTDYRMVISPLYEQRSFSERDKAVLKKHFGETLYDYSGVNRFTEDKHNYYEASHYRPHVGDSIMVEIYGSNRN